MNYYERHIGDYIKNTAHLTLLEHGIYSRLLDVYYTREAAIPDDKVARLVGARTEPETQALQVVLQEFFALVDGAWMQTRCDEDIARFIEGEPEREAKKANEDNRLKRHRIERAALFKIITDAGQHAPWNIGITDLRALVAVVSGAPIETAAATQPATAAATPATATQTPVTNPQSPVTSHQEQGKEKPPAPAKPWLTVAELVTDGLSEEVAAAWLAHRRTRKAKLTALAWDGFKAEVQKARWPIESAVLKAIHRNWTSVEADWLKGPPPAGGADDKIAEVERLLGVHNSQSQETFDA